MIRRRGVKTPIKPIAQVDASLRAARSAWVDEVVPLLEEIRKGNESAMKEREQRHAEDIERYQQTGSR